MPTLEFVSQSSRDASFIPSNTERLVNLYPEPVPEGGLARYALRSVPGTEAWAELPGVFLRALANVPALDPGTGAAGERLVAAIGGTLWRIAANGATTSLGAIPDSPETVLSGNRGVITITAGGQYHVWDGDALTQPASGAFDGFGSVDFIGGYTLLTEANGRRLQWSALEDATDLPGLNFATAEAADENIVRGVAITGNWWVFKARSVEVWAQTGLAGPEAFSRLPGAVKEVGLKGFGLIARFPNGAFFVGSDNRAHITAGLDIQPVSRVPVEQAIKEGEPTDCLYYEDAGHSFCVIRFRDRPAWCLDLATGMWHERASGTGAWSVTASAWFAGAWRFGSTGGGITAAARNNRDGEAPLIRQAVSRPLSMGPGKPFTVSKAHFMGRVGRSDIGRPASMLLRISRDGGNTWGPARVESMGGLGEYDKQITPRSLGQAGVKGPMVVELRITDPADLTLLSAAHVEVA